MAEENNNTEVMTPEQLKEAIKELKKVNEELSRDLADLPKDSEQLLEAIFKKKSNNVMLEKNSKKGHK